MVSLSVSEMFLELASVAVSTHTYKSKLSSEMPVPFNSMVRLLCSTAHVLQLKQSIYIYHIITCRVRQLMTQTLNAVQRRVPKRVSTLEHKLMTC